MKLYRFDGVDQTFDLLPLSARRALDHAGCKLSLEGFRSLPTADRLALSDLGSGELVDVSRVNALLLAAQPPPQTIAPVADPSPAAPDETVVAAFGAERPIPAASWSALSSLDRYALAKVARGKSPERLEQAYAEIIGQSAFSSHIAPDGGVRMVGVGGKQPSLRRAEAQSRVSMNAEAFERASNRDAPKGDVLGTARVAAIMAAKRTSELIPLCHPLALTKVDVQLSLGAATRPIDVSTNHWSPTRSTALPSPGAHSGTCAGSAAYS